MANVIDDFDLDSWLAEVSKDTEMSAEDRGALLALMTKKGVAKNLRGQVLKSQDYTQKTQKLADERRAFEAEQAKLTADRETLTNWRTQVETQLEDALGKLEKEQLTTAQYRTRIQQIADRNGLKVEDLMGGDLAPDAQPTKGPAKDIDASQFVTREEYNKASNSARAMASIADARTADLATEYAELYGQNLHKVEFTVPKLDGKGTEVVRGQEGLMRAAIASGEQLRPFAERHLKFSEKRHEMEIAQARKEGAEEAERTFRAKFGEGEDGRRPVFLDEQVPQNPAQKLIMGSDRGKPANGNGDGANQPVVRDRVARAMAAHRDRIATGNAWKE